MKTLLRLLVVLAIIFLIRPFFPAGYPYTHDGENHLARIEEYFSALKQGQFPPRWAPTFWGGYGYPVFNYNYPLPNILALPALVVRIPAETTMKIEQIVALIAGGAGVMLFLRDELGEEAALVGVLAFFTAPFLFNDLFVRGEIGEVLAYVLFPHVVYALKLAARKMTRFRALYLFASVLMLMLAHNIFVLVLMPIAMLYALVLHWKHLRSMDLFKNTASTLFVSGLAVLSSMFFWLPALLEKSLVAIDQSTLVRDATSHFPTLSQLLTSQYSFGYSYSTPVDSLSFNLGFAVILACILGAVIVLVRRSQHTKLIVSLEVLIGLSVFFMLRVSQPIWQLLPILKYLQFPWRLLLLTSLLGVYLLAVVYRELPRAGRVLLFLILAITVLDLSQKRVLTYIHYNDDYYKNYQLTTTVLDEDKPQTLLVSSSNLLPQMKVAAPDATIEINQWNGTRHDYTINAHGDQAVTEPTAYFPGWEVHIDGMFVPIEYQQAQGLIHFQVPSGVHHVTTVFTQQTPARLIGNGATVFAMIVFVGYLWAVGLPQTVEAQPIKESDVTHERRRQTRRSRKH
jgi:uncharacterized membrane protein